MTRRLWTLALLCTLAALLTACPAPAPHPQPTPEATATPAPTPQPVVTPTPGACTLGTPEWTAATNPRFVIHPQGDGYDVTPYATFGAAYCAKAGWYDGRQDCGVAPDGHPQRVACEQQFMRAQCPAWVMSRCTSNQRGACPLTFHIATWNQDQGKEVPYEANAPCPPQNNDQPQALAYKAGVSGIGYFKVCTGMGADGQLPTCTEYPEEINK